MEAEHRRARIDLPAGMAAMSTARHVARSILTGWGFTDPGWLDETEVIVTELVSNVVQHVGGPSCLEIEADLAEVTVAVVDTGARLPAVRTPDLTGGRGLLILDALAAAHGSRRRAGGKEVWARLHAVRPPLSDQRRHDGSDRVAATRGALRPLVDLATGDIVGHTTAAGGRSAALALLTVTVDPRTTGPADLLDEARRAREDGWTVDLRVGVDPVPLALMPLLRPDVITVEVPELRTCPPVVAARVAEAVREQAERTGALVSAAGIASAEDRDTARAFGARTGHGPFFGPRLPAPVGPPAPAHGLVDDVKGTPFDLVAAHRPVTRIAKDLLLPTSITIEQAGLERAEPIVVMGCFQHTDRFTGETRRRFADLAGSAVFVAALGVGIPERPAPGVHGGRLDADDPMSREWNVVALGPRTATALVARDCGDTGPDPDRRFDHAVTHDRALVVQAAEAILAAWAATRADTPAG